MEEKEAVVVQSNKLINGRYEMSLLERRIFLKMVSMIKTSDKDFQDFFINAKDIISDAALEGNSLYLELRKATKRLLQHVCEIDEETKLIQVSLLSTAIYHKGKGIIQLRFDPSLKPYLLELKNNFTIYGLQQALKLKSFYSLRIYELLKQFSSTGYRIISLEDLRFALGIRNEYTKYADFKKRIIVQARKELANTDMSFEFHEMKTGKKITSIKFTFGKKLIVKIDDNKDYSDRQPAYDALIKLKLSEHQAKQVLEKADDLSIFKALYEINVALLDSKIKNKTAYAFSVLKAKFGIS
jgi:plasmid replication initiation protein